MKFLSQAGPAPRLTITRINRKAVTNEAAGTITLFEDITKIEVTLPSIFNGIREAYRKFTDALRSAFLPHVYAY